MIQGERHFQYLAALAAAHQISDAELDELRDHVADCSSCSQRMAEMESANLQLFLTLATQIKKPRISSGLQERFFVRAAESGVVMARPVYGFERPNFLHLAALLVAICLVVGVGWRQVTQGSARRTIGQASPMKTKPPAQLSTSMGPGMVLSEIPVAERFVDRSRSRHHTTKRTGIAPLPVANQEPPVAARPPFLLDPAFFPGQPLEVNTAVKRFGFHDVSAESFALLDAGHTPRFSAPAVWSSNATGNPNQRVFHYSATLASISLQDDQAVFGLKPRERDLSFSNALASVRLR